MKKLLNSNFGSFSGSNYIKITPTIVLKPKNMINIPGTLAKIKNQVIYMTLSKSIGI